MLPHYIQYPGLGIKKIRSSVVQNDRGGLLVENIQKFFLEQGKGRPVVRNLQVLVDVAADFLLESIGPAGMKSISSRHLTAFTTSDVETLSPPARHRAANGSFSNNYIETAYDQ